MPRPEQRPVRGSLLSEAFPAGQAVCPRQRCGDCVILLQRRFLAGLTLGSTKG
jgi:hypothetical protein